MSISSFGYSQGEYKIICKEQTFIKLLHEQCYKGLPEKCGKLPKK